jgi:hypothetical protein
MPNNLIFRLSISAYVVQFMVVADTCLWVPTVLIDMVNGIELCYSLIKDHLLKRPEIKIQTPTEASAKIQTWNSCDSQLCHATLVHTFGLDLWPWSNTVFF